jgi:hypothetical protein
MLPVTLVWDRFDDLPHTLAALDAHDPDQGRITVHPTPGTDSLTALAWDVLAALGKPTPLTCYFIHDTDAPWAIAAAWALACEITHLTVLRAHLLTDAHLGALLALRNRTGLRLAVVCHQRRIPTVLERALRTVPHRIADATAALPGPAPGRLKTSAPIAPAVAVPSPPTRPLAGRWLNLPALTTLAAIDGDEPLCRCTTPTAEQRGFYPPLLPTLTAAEVAYRLRTATAHPHLAAALATACFTAASTTQLDTVHLTDLAPGAEAITLHDSLGQRQFCMQHPVPPWARPRFLAAVYLQRFTRTDRPLLTEDPLSGRGLPGLTGFAETCKLRPPQPPRPKRARGRRRRPSLSEPATVWPLCSAHYHFRWAAIEQMDGCPQPPDYTRPGRRGEQHSGALHADVSVEQGEEACCDVADAAHRADPACSVNAGEWPDGELGDGYGQVGQQVVVGGDP